MDFLKTVFDVFTKNVDNTSPTGKVDKNDLAKITKNALIVGVAAALSAVLANVGPQSFGTYQPLIILGLSAALDFLNKMVKSNQPKE
jgi:hypothetical protein